MRVRVVLKSELQAEIERAERRLSEIKKIVVTLQPDLYTRPMKTLVTQMRAQKMADNAFLYAVSIKNTLPERMNKIKKG